MNRNANTTRQHGFTLIELLVSILIIGVLIGLLLVGIQHALRAAKATAGLQDVNSLNMGVQTFKNDFGFLPPLVKDGYPGTPGAGEHPLVKVGSGRQERFNPNIYDLADPTTGPANLRFLQDDTKAADYRFSVYSLSYYIMGALGEKADYVEGPGAHPPRADGSFNPLSNEKYGPLFDNKTGRVTQTAADSDQGRIELQDARGVAYRYYRWEHVSQGTPGYDANKPLRNLRLPKVFGSARLESDPDYSLATDSLEFRDAGYAIVAAGADGVFGDIPIESIDTIEEVFGKTFQTDAEAEDAARADNIVEVGR